MTTRRAFLKGIGAGFILPSAWDLFANHLENHGEPLLRRPRHVEDVLYVFNNGAEDYRVGLNQADYEWPDPDMTIKEYAAKFGDHYWHWDHDEDYEYGDESRPIGEWFAYDYWPSNRSPDALAYDYLDNLRLGWFDRGSEVKEGYVDFVCGPCPGNDSKFVDVDLLGASILQDRLIERGHDVLVKLV